MSTLDRMLPIQIGSFELFSSLPKELRLAIVEFALAGQDGQIIIVTSTFEEVTIPQNPDNPDASYGSYNSMVEKYRAIYNIPSVLQVNRELRQIGLKHYHCLEENFIYPLYFDPLKDTWFLDGSYTLNILKYFKWSEKSLQIMKQLRSVGVGGKIMSWLANCLHKSSCPLTIFEELDSLTLQADDDAPISKSRVAAWVKRCWTEMYRLANEERQKSAMLQASSDELQESLAIPNHLSHDVLMTDDVPDVPDQVHISHLPKVYFKSKTEMEDLGMRSLWVETIEVQIESRNVMEYAQTSSTIHPASQTSTPSIFGPARPRPDRASAGACLPVTASSAQFPIPSRADEINPRAGGSTSLTPSIFGTPQLSGIRDPSESCLSLLPFNSFSLDQTNKGDTPQRTSSSSPLDLHSYPSRFSRNNWSMARPGNGNTRGVLGETANNESNGVPSPLSSIPGHASPPHPLSMREFTAPRRSHPAHCSSLGISPVAYRTPSVGAHYSRNLVACPAPPSALSVLFAGDRTYAVSTYITPSQPSRILRRPPPYATNTSLLPPSSIAARRAPGHNLNTSETTRNIWPSGRPDDNFDRYASSFSNLSCGTKSPLRKGRLTSHRSVYEDAVRDLPTMVNNYPFAYAAATASEASRELSQSSSRGYSSSGSQFTTRSYSSPYTAAATLNPNIGSPEASSQFHATGVQAWDSYALQH